MKTLLLPATALLLTAPAALRAQSVGIGTTSPASSAALEVAAANPSTAPQGFLPPRLTKAQREAIQNPSAGLLVYQTDSPGGAPAGLYLYGGSSWSLLPASSTGDNLGNHTATQNLNLGPNLLVGNGGTQGLSIGSGGQVGIGTSSPAARLQVNTSTGAEAKTVETQSSNSRYADGASTYQSFTAVNTGRLSRIALFSTGTWGSSTLTIRDGEGLGGAVLYTGTNNFTAAGWIETVVSAPVVAGRKYSVVLSNRNGWSASPDNYAGGRSSDPTIDMGLRVWEQDYSVPTLAVQDNGVVAAAQLSLGGAATAVSGISPMPPWPAAPTPACLPSGP